MNEAYAQGQSTSLVVEMKGRVERDAKLWTRPLNGDWKTVTLTEVELKESTKDLRRYEIPMTDIQ